MSDLTHVRIKSTKQVDEDTEEIETRTFTDKPNTYKHEISKNIKTSKNTILGDLVGCLDVISNGESRELTIKITVNKFSQQPDLIVKTWTTKKEYLGK